MSKDWQCYSSNFKSVTVYTDLVQALDKALIIFWVAFNHSSHWIRKPLLKFPMWLEYVGHKKVHQRPQFHQIILQGCASQEETPVKDQHSFWFDDTLKLLKGLSETCQQSQSYSASIQKQEQATAAWGMILMRWICWCMTPIYLQLR
jgi:hypothetical protein